MPITPIHANSDETKTVGIPWSNGEINITEETYANVVDVIVTHIVMVRIHKTTRFFIGNPLTSKKIMLKEATKETVLKMLKILYSSGHPSAKIDCPAACSSLSSCQTPPGGSSERLSSTRCGGCADIGASVITDDGCGTSTARHCSVVVAAVVVDAGILLATTPPAFTSNSQISTAFKSFGMCCITSKAVILFPFNSFTFTAVVLSRPTSAVEPVYQTAKFVELQNSAGRWSTRPHAPPTQSRVRSTLNRSSPPPTRLPCADVICDVRPSDVSPGDYDVSPSGINPSDCDVNPVSCDISALVNYSLGPLAISELLSEETRLGLVSTSHVDTALATPGSRSRGSSGGSRGFFNF
ncbi:hypothetical protein Acr_01g0003430 [Actinidia rufa]|uniref:Uncharacterized protein n=1 Tax=Actinidia rufa TaxID=165716 RepID=A0A7J0E234_9ERIC|nr:hypothetical protein Acr_01g0003430 [Actinidia rufa]